MSDRQPTAVLTHHALLVLWGQFAQHIGLVAGLQAISLGQKTYTFRPQTKLIEFFVAVLAGLPYLKDLSHAAHPIDQDQVVATAWAQPAWADASGVSRTLQAMTQSEADHVTRVLWTISRPFVDREIALSLQRIGRLVFDVDLTGRQVSNTSTTYPGVAFGYLSDAVHLGYQASLVTMHSPTYGRLWLAASQHPGDTRSYTQVAALVRVTEERTGIRPRRRTGLLEERLTTLAAAMERKTCGFVAQQSVAQRHQDSLAETHRQVEEHQAIVATLAASYAQRGRSERPYSALAQARRRLLLLQQRHERCQKAVTQSLHDVSRHKHVVAALTDEQIALRDRLARFEHDNATNPNPVHAEIRLDAGFGTGDNVALLIEMGYEVYTKPCNQTVTVSLKRLVTSTTVWQRVGDNAEMTSWPSLRAGGCCYALDIALERFWTGATQKHSTLLHYGDDRVLTDLSGWFHRYNGRQIIEAGIKEGKQVFQMRHLKVRSTPALFLQEQFAVFAANVVRWAAQWATTRCQRRSLGQGTMAPMSIKDHVQVAAHTSAWVTWLNGGCLLRFTHHSVYTGQTLEADHWALQLALPTHKTCESATS